MRKSFPEKCLCGGFTAMYNEKTEELSRFYKEIPILEHEKRPLNQKERLAAIAGPLLAWYGKRARALPWRENAESYRVWVSEIMLQQTRVEAVKPYFNRFMEAFPTVSALAKASDDYLMKMWEGLGYYSRARNLKAAAKIICEEYGGSLPASREELLKLPGIGSYTAGAIASIAFGIPVPAVDGNVLRVITRLLGDRSDIRQPAVKTRIEAELSEMIPEDNAGSYNQGLIEIGALVCVPGGEPKCLECPLYGICLTGKNGWWKEIPVKSPAKARKIEEKTVFVIKYHGKTAIRRRPAKGLLASLYEFPNVEGKLTREQIPAALGVEEALIDRVEEFPPAKHIFSHVEWHMTGYRVELKDCIKPPLDCFMADENQLQETYALPGAFDPFKKSRAESL